MLATNIAAGIEVREDIIRRHVAEQMPFMATERWLMLGTAAGGDRQTLHEVVRKHSLAVAETVSRGEPNTLLDRLGSDPAFRGVSTAALQAELEPDNYTGRAAQQVGEFIEDYLLPLWLRARPFAVRSRAGGGEGMKTGAAASDTTLTESRLPLPLLRRGKVREVYEVDAGHLLVVASDRVSAFDVVMREAIPRKGAVLTQISAFWFELLADVFPSHYVTARTSEILEQVPRLDGLEEQIAGRAMLVRRAEPVPFECVVRGYHLGIGLGGVSEPGNAGRRAAATRPGRKCAAGSAALLARYQGGVGARYQRHRGYRGAGARTGFDRQTSASQLCALPGRPRSRGVSRDHHRRHQVRVRRPTRRARCG